MAYYDISVNKSTQTSYVRQYLFFGYIFGNCTLNPQVGRETHILEPITPVIDYKGRIIAD